jgi:hypothetical protein
MLEKGSAKLAAAITNKKFNDIGTAEVFITAANDNLHILKTKLTEKTEEINDSNKYYLNFISSFLLNIF